MSANESSLKPTPINVVQRMIVLVTTLCLVVPLCLFVNSRSAQRSEDRVKAGHQELKSNNNNNQTAAAVPQRLVDPLFIHPVNATTTTTKDDPQPDNVTKLVEFSNSNDGLKETVVHDNRNSSSSSAGYDRIVVELNHTFAFWRNGQSSFCDVIRQVTKVDSIGSFPPHHVVHNTTPPLLRVTLNCVEITTSKELATGNWITAVYVIRMAAALGMVDLEIKCKDADLKQDLHHLITWYMGYYPAPTEFQKWPYDPPVPDERTVCNNHYGKLRIDTMAHEIQSDVRKLAVTVLGTRSELGWSHPLVPQDQPPMVTGVELDEVAIHFRCGDVFGGARRHDFGVIHFSEYKKWISPTTTKSLGIVTQPFTKGNYTRVNDFRKAEQCRQAVTLLVDYLYDDFLPNTTLIRIRNNVNEPLAVTYARMVMSKQVFVSYSSFGIFPLIGTFGEGYFQRGNRGVNPWAVHVPNTLPNVHMMVAPSMTSWNIARAGLNATLTWLVSPINDTQQM